MTDKMRDFIKGLLPGLVGAPLPYTGTEPVSATVPMCSYNGIIMPPLPADWNRATHPYAVICRVNDRSHQLFVSAEIPYVTDSGSLHFAAPGSCNNIKKLYRWSDIGYQSSDYNGFAADTVVWSNFDFYYNGTLLCAASDPVPTSLPYVITMLFNGEAITADNGNGINVSVNLTSDNAGSFSSGNAYRVTIDGVSSVVDVGGSVGSYYLGNPYLYKSSNYEDNGGFWCLRATYSFITKKDSYILYTRTPGTYLLKIESVRE